MTTKKTEETPRALVATIDIGKTNKRVVLFDPSLAVVDQVAESIAEVTGPGGVRFEDIKAIEDFVDAALAEFARHYPIGAVGISSHAGTWVGLDESGRRSLGVIAYTNDRAQSESQALLERLGGEELLYQETATPRLPAFVNMGIGVGFAQRHFLKEYEKTAHIVNLPQYLGFRLTGALSVELTYLGCHTYLWNLRRNEYSRLAWEVGYRDRAPRVPTPTRSLFRPICDGAARRLGIGRDCMIHLGVHDSNAALVAAVGPVPQEETALLSTGTWCVAMAPGEGRLSADDRRRGIILNLDVDGRPVRTSIYRAGGLYATLRAMVDDRFDGQEETQEEGDYPRVHLPESPKPEDVVVEMAGGRRTGWVQALGEPTIDRNARGRWLTALGNAFAAAAWDQLACIGIAGRTRLVVEGGFRRNRSYVHALGRLAEPMTIEVAADDLGSARGAARLALDARALE